MASFDPACIDVVKFNVGDADADGERCGRQRMCQNFADNGESMRSERAFAALINCDRGYRTKSHTSSS